MNFDDVIINRCSARCFTSENISEKKIEQILYGASLAPSAKNRQPWKFYILNDKQKNDITKMLYDWEKLNPNERTSVKGTAEQISITLFVHIYHL